MFVFLPGASVSLSNIIYPKAVIPLFQGGDLACTATFVPVPPNFRRSSRAGCKIRKGALGDWSSYAGSAFDLDQPRVYQVWVEFPSSMKPKRALWVGVFSRPKDRLPHGSF